MNLTAEYAGRYNTNTCANDEKYSAKNYSLEYSFSALTHLFCKEIYKRNIRT